MSDPNFPPPPPPYDPPPPPPSGPTGPTGPGPGTTAGGPVSPNRTIMLVLSYLGPLALIPLLMEKEDREVQWHAKHGLVLFVAELILIFAVSIATTALSFLDLGCTGCLVSVVMPIAILILHIVCIVKAVNGQRFIIPGISDFANRF